MKTQKFGRGDIFAIAPAVMIFVLTVPLLAGLIGVLLPAFGYFPSLGGDHFTLQYFHDVLHVPGFWHSAKLSLWTGVATTFVSLAIVISFFASFWGSRPFQRIVRFISPLMSVPHAAAAFGLAFLIAPSGWIVRLVSPWATGFHHPPDWLIVNDPTGKALLFGLVLKEVPFLFLMGISASSQINVEGRLKVAMSLGYGRVWAWITSVFPALYKQIRLPVFAVIAFSSSVVDVALILGPNHPAMLPVQLLRWMNDPMLEMRFIAAAGAIYQLGITVLALATWWVGELVVCYVGRRMMISGERHQNDQIFRNAALIMMGGVVLVSLLGLITLLIWSFAGFWRFPDVLPTSLSTMRWMRVSPDMLWPALNSINIAVVSTGLSIALSIFCLENEYRRDLTVTSAAIRILYLPLIVPQIAFLFGLSVLLVRFGLDGSFWPVALTHMIFVLPYMFLSLSAAFRQFDVRYLKAAASLGATPNEVLFKVRLPMLLKPVLFAAALGVAISIAQYLPTLLVGAGRVPTITTDAIALAAGGDRRLIGIYATVQTLLSFIGFLAAVLLPKLLFPNKKYFG